MTDKEIVEEFLDAICDGGSPVAQCDFCKSIWFVAGGDYMDEGELYKMIKLQENEPAKYFSTDASSVSSGCAFGRQFVWECQCKKSNAAILSIYDERDTIIQALKKISEKKKLEAAEESDTVDGL